MDETLCRVEGHLKSASRGPISGVVRIFTVALLAVVAIAAAVLHASETQRTVAEENSDPSAAEGP
jgi:hypothetical protein